MDDTTDKSITNVMGRCQNRKRGHQYHVRFRGNRCSKVNAEQVLAALRVGDQIPISQMTYQDENMVCDVQPSDRNANILNEFVHCLKMTDEQVSSILP